MRGHIDLVVADEGVACLVVVLDVFPKSETLLEILILKYCVGTDYRGANIVSAQLLREGGRTVTDKCHIDPSESVKSLYVTLADVHIRLGHPLSER